jgi:hypothetical protein
MRTAIAALLLLLASVDGPRLSFQTVRQFDLAFLTHQQAWELNGQRIVCRVDLDSRPDERGAFTVYDCASPDDTYRTVWLRDGEQAEGTMTVEGTVRLRYVPPGVRDRRNTFDLLGDNRPVSGVGLPRCAGPDKSLHTSAAPVPPHLWGLLLAELGPGPAHQSVASSTAPAGGRPARPGSATPWRGVT